MISVKKNGAEVASYIYHPFGRRIKDIKVKEDGSVTLYTNDDVVYRKEGAEVTKYIVTNGKYLAKVVSGEPTSENGTFFFHTDMLGSTRAITNSSGQTVANYDYEPFGKVSRASGILVDAEKRKFTGKTEDKATGLDYFNARYYDPEVGRFISPDPAQDGLNWYVYCGDNPVNRIDQNGRFSSYAHLCMTDNAAHDVGFVDNHFIIEMRFANKDTDNKHLSSCFKEEHYGRGARANVERNFELAVAYWNNDERDKAAQCLGEGMHSLADLFSHTWGVSPQHWARYLGLNIDSPDDNPNAYYEAYKACFNYLKDFLDSVGIKKTMTWIHMRRMPKTGKSIRMSTRG
jgi:RHS repeat-associated protein